MSSPVRYVVRRQEYTPPTAAGVRRVLPEKWTTVATFAKPADAYAEWSKLTLAACRTLNPFQLGGPSLFYQTSLPAFAFHDYLLDHGLTPPPTSTSSNPNYVFWWVKNNRAFTDAQRAVVWQACDKLKLFEVVEEDDRQAAWLVVEVPWGNTDGRQWAAATEGGFVRSAWRTRRDARGRREITDGKLLMQFDDENEFHLHYREGYQSKDPWLNRYEIPFSESVRVPCSTASTTTTAHVVVRQGYARPSGGYELEPDRFRWNWGVRVPLVGFAESREATTWMTEVKRRASRSVNPFALVWADDFQADALLLAEELDDGLLPNGLSVSAAFEVLDRLDTTPPYATVGLLADWYDQVVQWSPEYIDVIWGTFADFRLFEVIEVPFG